MNRNRNFLLSGFAALVLLFACKPQGSLYITNVHDITSFEQNSTLYALPQTRLKVTVAAVVNTVVPGPYAAYSKELLSIEGAPTMMEVHWYLGSIEVQAFREPDPDHYYSVRDEGYGLEPSCFSYLSQAGLMLSPSDYVTLSNSVDNTDIDPEGIHFTDLSVKRNLAVENKKEFKRVFKDSAYVKIPVLRKQLQAKTQHEKAIEAANFIIKTRKRRFKLAAGQYEVFPEGEALATAIEELDEVEADYLSLFIGKTYQDTIVKSFWITPRPGEDIQRHVLFRFSDENGFVDQESAMGKPGIVEIKDLGRTSVLEQKYFSSSMPSKENQLIYRIPDKASLKILYGSHVLFEQELPIDQFGAVVPYNVPPKAK